MIIRIGHGYDVHCLEENRKLIVGGVEIPYEKGLQGHSDGDVLIHAIIDSILGALGEGDIGTLFPDTDQQYKDINSLVLLEKTYNILLAHFSIINNIDATIVAQAPKFALFIPKMVENIASVLHCNLDQINIKATTEEYLGFTGQGLGIAAHSVCLVTKGLD